MSEKFVLMKKSRKRPCVGDVFVLQPSEGKYYFGKVIQTDLESRDSFIRGMNLIYIYDFCTNEKELVNDFDGNGLLISLMVVNHQPWLKGYFSRSTSQKPKSMFRSLIVTILLPIVSKYPFSHG